jgi:hypothetical protein
MLNYKKNKNGQVLKKLEEYLNVSSLQNYVPLYNRFFNLNDTNWNSINLDTFHTLKNVTFKDELYSNKTPIFCKFSPLLDPLKYLTGSYETYKFNLPSITTTLPKLSDVNNSSYVDSFFSYLSSRLLHDKFIHGNDFYGSYLGIKTDFQYNVEEDLEHLEDSSFFHANRGKLFDLNRDFSFPGSRKNKGPLQFSEDVELVLDSLEDTDSIQSDHSDELNLYAILKQFPVQVIAMEKYTDTLDSLLGDIEPDELTSALIQVIFTLIAYQKVFQFTHNDLHTNNVMYMPTTITHLYYCFNSIHYKVPTFGKIFKLIDYGRAIYTFKNNRFVSDSFHEDGDAATQYNIEPYFDCSEPLLSPNYSFDLCRLSCSILEGMPETDGIYGVISEWSQDDKGDSVIYTENGDERYPDFELYRMISRTVHLHTPEAQLKRPIFSAFQTTDRNKHCMNIDLYSRQ